MKINKQIGWIVAGGILLYSSCSKLDPETPEVSSYESKALPVVTITNAHSDYSTTATAASLAWTIVPNEPKRIRKLYFCYRDERSEVPVDTTNYRVDLIPLLKNGQDTIKLSDLHSGAIFHYRIYIETIDSAGYMPFTPDNAFSTQSDVCHKAWTYIADFPGGGVDYRTGFSFSTESKGYAGMASDDISVGAFFDPTFWEYDPLVDRWIRKADFPGIARWGYISFAIGKKGYVGMGVTVKNGRETDLLRDFWEYDTETNEWTRLKDFPYSRRKALTFAVCGKGYILCGSNISQVLSDMWEYDPETDTWRECPGIPEDSRFAATAFALGDKAYVLGGYDKDNQRSSDLWQYDPKRNAWNRKADFPAGGWAEMYVLPFDTMAILGSGYGNKMYDEPMWQYTPSQDRWIDKRNTPHFQRPDYVTFTIGNYGYLGHPFGILRYDPRVDTE